MAAPVYRIIGTPVHVNKWDSQLQETVEGWQIKALWLASNTVIPVWIADENYSADNVNTLVMAAGPETEKVKQLGR